MKSLIKGKVFFVVALLFGLLFINAGLDKFFHYMPLPENSPGNVPKVFIPFMEIGWLMPLVGLAQIIGGLLIIISKTRALGALIIFPIMVGIFLTNIGHDKSLLISIVLGIILIWIMYENRQKYFLLISKS